MAQVPTLRAYVAGGSAILTKSEVRNRMADAFALACAVVCLYSMRRADPDFWGYLSYGKLFAEQRRAYLLNHPEIKKLAPR